MSENGPNKGGARRGADHVVDALRSFNVDTVFSLSGNQIMPVYDALIGSDIRLVHTRHEGAAVYMAEAYAQLTDKVGVALLTAGPGFANGLSAMWSARESETPLVVMSGDAPIKLSGQGAFQEMNQQSGALAFAKSSMRVEYVGDLYDAVRDAVSLALDGTLGPVHLSLPDDVLREVCERGAPSRRVPSTFIESLTLTTSPYIIDKIKAANRPVIVAGPMFARPKWKRIFRRFSRLTGIPLFAVESPRGLRAPRIGALADVLPNADLVVLMSMTPNFMLGFGTTAIAGDAEFICLSDKADGLDNAISRLGDKQVKVIPFGGLRALMELMPDVESFERLMPNKADQGWSDRVMDAIAWRPPEWADLPADKPPFHAASVAYAVKPFLDANPDLSLIIDGGEVGQWCQAILDTTYSVINGPSGAIGGSIPYAIAAKAARPDHPSIAILGDGTAGFYFMEFETAIREELPFVAIVGNDARWNAEHQIQLRDYGENRTFACEMHPTQYDEIAKAMGGYGENVTEIGELVPAIERAIASGKPACLNVEIESVPAPVIRQG